MLDSFSENRFLDAWIRFLIGFFVGGVVLWVLIGVVYLSSVFLRKHTIIISFGFRREYASVDLEKNRNQCPDRADRRFIKATEEIHPLSSTPLTPDTSDIEVARDSLLSGSFNQSSFLRHQRLSISSIRTASLKSFTPERFDITELSPEEKNGKPLTSFAYGDNGLTHVSAPTNVEILLTPSLAENASPEHINKPISPVLPIEMNPCVIATEPNSMASLQTSLAQQKASSPHSAANNAYLRISNPEGSAQSFTENTQLAEKPLILKRKALSFRHPPVKIKMPKLRRSRSKCKPSPLTLDSNTEPKKSPKEKTRHMFGLLRKKSKTSQSADQPPGSTATHEINGLVSKHHKHQAESVTGVTEHEVMQESGPQNHEELFTKMRRSGKGRDEHRQSETSNDNSNGERRVDSPCTASSCPLPSTTIQSESLSLPDVCIPMRNEAGEVVIRENGLRDVETPENATDPPIPTTPVKSLGDRRDARRHHAVITKPAQANCPSDRCEKELCLPKAGGEWAEQTPTSHFPGTPEKPNHRFDFLPKSHEAKQVVTVEPRVEGALVYRTCCDCTQDVAVSSESPTPVMTSTLPAFINDGTRL